MSWLKSVKQALQCSKLNLDFPLHTLNTMRVGGQAECLVDIADQPDFLALMSIIEQRRIPWYVLGRGSNVIFPDDGMTGIVMRFSKNTRFLEQRGDCIYATAGVPNGQLVAHAQQWQLSGLEYAFAIPGSVGGLVATNAGAHHSDTASVLKSITCYELGRGLKDYTVQHQQFSYRQSPYVPRAGYIVWSALFRCQPSAESVIKSNLERVLQYRKQTQPRGVPNSGSVFRNPQQAYAAKLIESSGLKRSCIGDAMISDLHANFIVNNGKASAADIKQLIKHVQYKVEQEHGVILQPEIEFAQPVTRWNANQFLKAE